MSLEASVLSSARACEGAALALSHSLRRAASAPSPAATLVDTFREAEAFAITVRAVLEEAAPLLPLLRPAAACVGRTPGLVHPAGRVTNGFDAIAVVLVALLDAAVDAILHVAGNSHRWLVPPMHAAPAFEKMVGHHGQLRAMYGIVHLAAKIVAHADVRDTLFVDVAADGSHPELEPGKWRAAIKMDDFYGRHFGFHYAPEMRNVLRVVNIARGSVHKSHRHDDETSPLIRNMTMLGWGWVYSNMVLMNSFGLNIDGVSQIGADLDKGGMSIHALRKFMNLVEEPLISGVTGLAGVDVAIDKVFEIPKPGDEDGLESPDSPVHSEKLRAVLATVHQPVCARLMSLKHRPVNMPNKNKNKSPLARGKHKHKEKEKVRIDMAAASSNPRVEANAPGTTPLHAVGGVPEPAYRVHEARTEAAINVVEQQQQQQHRDNYSGIMGPAMRRGEMVEQEAFLVKASSFGDCHAPTELINVPSVEGIEPTTTTAKEATTGEEAVNDGMGASGSGEDATNVVDTGSAREKSSPTSSSHKVKRKAPIEKTEGSYLASTIKTELFRLQTNMSMLLGIEEIEPASGLILHFHGGGFVSQSSEGHALYLKEWCADIPDAVLLSIDYKLAPEHRFPVAVHEGVYAYIWAMQNAERLGTRCDTVVFTGDSAGGNLAVATALLVNELGLRGPDGICIAYPALYVKIAWSPSRLLSFFDPLLPLSVLELCVKSYLPLQEEDEEGESGGGGGGCALLSPVVADEAALRQLAPVTMVCGSLDPLLDDAVLFAHRLRKAGRSGDVMRVYEAMPHGFLNMQQVNVRARSAMRLMAKTMAGYLGVPLRTGSKAANPDGEEAGAAGTAGADL